MTQIKSIMSKNLKTISAGASLQDAYTIMEEFRIRHLPVLDESGDITGIISYKNLIAEKSVLLMPVEFFMSFPVVEITEDTSLKRAILILLEKKISSPLITNDELEVVGIVTTDDLLWHLASQLKTEDDDNAPLMSSKGVQTIGEIARLLSQAGI